MWLRVTFWKRWEVLNLAEWERGEGISSCRDPGWRIRGRNEHKYTWFFFKPEFDQLQHTYFLNAPHVHVTFLMLAPCPPAGLSIFTQAIMIAQSFPPLCVLLPIQLLPRAENANLFWVKQLSGFYLPQNKDRFPQLGAAEPSWVSSCLALWYHLFLSHPRTAAPATLKGLWLFKGTMLFFASMTSLPLLGCCFSSLV